MLLLAVAACSDAAREAPAPEPGGPAAGDAAPAPAGGAGLAGTGPGAAGADAPLAGEASGPDDAAQEGSAGASDAGGAAGASAGESAAGAAAAGRAPSDTPSAQLPPFCDGDNDACLPCRDDGWAVPGGDAGRTFRTGPAHGIDASTAADLRLAYTAPATSGEAMVVGDRIVGAHMNAGAIRGTALPPYALELRVASVTDGGELTECRRTVDQSATGGTGRSVLMWELPVSYRAGVAFLPDPTIPVLSFMPLLPGQFCAYDLDASVCRYQPVPHYSDPPVFAAGVGAYLNETHAAVPSGTIETSYELVAFDADTGGSRSRFPITFPHCGYLRGPRAGLSGPALSSDGRRAFVLATECEGPPVRRKLYAAALDGSGLEMLYDAGAPPAENQPARSTETSIQMPIVFPKGDGGGSWVGLARMDGSFAVVDGSTGAERWRTELGVPRSTHLSMRYALADDRFVVLRYRDRDPADVCVPRDCVPEHEAVLAALDRDTGDVLWERSMERLPLSTWQSDDTPYVTTLPPVTVTDDVGFVAGYRLEVFALADGAGLFTHELDGLPSQLPVKLVGGRVFVQADDTLHVFELAP